MRTTDLKGIYQSLFAPISLIGLIHIIGGSAILASPYAAKVSALVGVGVFTRYPWVGLILITVGVLALWARVLPLAEPFRILFIAPQQVVLLIQAIGVLTAVWKGVYPDGYMPAPTVNDLRWFILGDQAPILVLCLSHFFDMIFARQILMTQEQFERHLSDEEKQIEILKAQLDLSREVKKMRVGPMLKEKGHDPGTSTKPT